MTYINNSVPLNGTISVERKILKGVPATILDLMTEYIKCVNLFLYSQLFCGIKKDF